MAGQVEHVLQRIFRDQKVQLRVGPLRLRGDAFTRVAFHIGSGSMIGLPSLRALDRTQGPRIWLAAEATDMRCGVSHEADSTIVQHGYIMK
jgi:hypothetical protein